MKFLIVSQTDKAAPFIHDLVKLSQIAGVELDEVKIKQLKEITTFNIAGRYDDEKKSFYKKCTKIYAQKYFKICEQIYLWLISYQKKF